MKHSFPTRRSSELGISRRKLLVPAFAGMTRLGNEDELWVLTLNPRQHRPLGHKRRGLALGHHDMVGAAPHQVRDLLVRMRARDDDELRVDRRSEEHTSELQSLMRISYAVFCLKQKNQQNSL